MACAQTADPNVVCTASSIPTFTVRRILSFTPVVEAESGTPDQCCWRVPIFQRRYCWGSKQLQKLLHDIMELCPTSTAPMGRERTHALGRLMVAADPTGGVILIDGQQRLTTLCILLSSIRDYLLNLLPSASAAGRPTMDVLIKQCNDFILPNGTPALQPTYFDRESFYACLDPARRASEPAVSDGQTPRLGRTSAGGTTADHVKLTRQFFDTQLNSGVLACKMGLHVASSDDDTLSEAAAFGMCTALASAVLDKLSMLFFLVRESDIQSVYERLAMREALIATGTYNGAPGVSMSECDLARNLVTSYGCGEEAQLAIYSEYWAPVEDMASTVASKSKSKLTEVLDRFISQFLADLAVAETETVSSEAGEVKTNVTAWFDPGLQYFPMYSSLKRCVNNALQAKGLPIAMEIPTKEAEEVVVSMLTDMRVKGEAYWSRVGAGMGPPTASAKRPGAPCPCYARGTLCTDCIVKKCTKK